MAIGYRKARAVANPILVGYTATMHRFSLLLLAVACLALTAGAKKQKAVSLRVYPEGGTEGGQFSKPIELLSGKKVVNMATMPLLNEADVLSAYVFPDPNGTGTYGAYFKLEPHGTKLLEQQTLSKRGTYLMVFYNGRHVTDLYIDRPVQDGLFVIPAGLTLPEADLLQYDFPIIGKEGEKLPKRPKMPKEKKPAETPQEA